jgi:hypothetical protein
LPDEFEKPIARRPASVYTAAHSRSGA